MSADGLTLTWLPWLGGLAFKSLLVFLVAGLILLALRRASASARHLVCLLTLAALLALPILSLSLPGWRLTVLASPAPSPAPAPLPPAAAMMPASAGVGEPTKVIPVAPPSARLAPLLVLPPPAPRPFPWTVVLSALWLGGALLALLRPLLGLWGIARLSRDSTSVADAPILALLSEAASALALRRMPALRQADAPVPMTWGWRRPVVLLPTDAYIWPKDRLRAVLLHELAHIRRRDWLSHRFADLVCALYWFHPLVWLTARRLRAEGEIACDDLVLTSGVAAPDYARHLLEVARALRPAPAVPQAAIAMARTAHIEGRLKMILDTTRPRRALTRRALLFALGFSAAALVPLAVLRPGARVLAAAPGVQAVTPGVVSTPHRHRVLIHGTPATPASVWMDNKDIRFVQLAGVANPTTLKWWGVDGVPLTQPVYGISPALPSDRLPDPKQRRVQIAFRLPPTAQGVTVKYALTDSLGFSSGGSWPEKTEDYDRRTEAQLNEPTNGLRVVTATFPASVSKTNVRVGIADSPWKVIGTARRDASGQIEGLSLQRGHTGYIFSPLGETKQGTMLTISVNAAGSSAEDLRLVAVDGQGRPLLPADIGDSSIGALDQITAHFALPPAQIKEIRLESRPFRYAEFKNVALRPAR